MIVDTEKIRAFIKKEKNTVTSNYEKLQVDNLLVKLRHIENIAETMEDKEEKIIETS